MTSLEEKFVDGISSFNVDVIAECIKSGIDPNFPIQYDKTTALHRAVEMSCFRLAKMLVSCENLNINAITHFGDAPLHRACYRKNFEMVELLLQSGANVDFRNRFGKNALHIIAFSKSLSIATLLINYNIEMNALDYCNDTPLAIAVDYGYAPMVQLLLDSGVNSNVATKKPSLILRLALDVHSKARLEMLRLLHDNNCDIQAVDYVTKRNALHYAAMSDYLPLLVQLIDWGVDPKKKDFMRVTPWDVAKSHKRMDTAFILAYRKRNSVYDDIKYYVDIVAICLKNPFPF